MGMEFQGEKLKKIRQELGLSLEEAQKKTKINLNILKAIEGDSITNLEPVYLKGFLKIYCKFLGVDPKEYITEHKAAKENIEEAVKKPLLKSPRQSFRAPRIDIRKVAAALISILLITSSCVLLFNLGKSVSLKKKDSLVKKTAVSGTPQKSVNLKAQAQQQVKTAVVAQSAAPMEFVPSKSASSGIRLGIRARENCWVQVKTDGRLVFQRTLEKGRFESWQAKDKIDLSLGNAGAVELEVNGQIFSNLGRKGEVRKNIMITKEGLNIGK